MATSNDAKLISGLEKHLLGNQFKRRDPTSPIVPLDEARAEVLLACTDADQLLSRDKLQDFVRSLHGATWGNPDVLPLLVQSFNSRQAFDNERARATLEFLWDSFDEALSESTDSFYALKSYYSAPPNPLSPSIVQAIFDDRSLDFGAFIRWNGPLLNYAISDDLLN